MRICCMQAVALAVVNGIAHFRGGRRQFGGGDGDRSHAQGVTLSVSPNIKGREISPTLLVSEEGTLYS